MPRPSEGPKCPTPEEIDNLVDLCNEFINHAEQANPKQALMLERLIEILDWAGEQVNKRRLYSKKFQLKDKERTRLLKEKLGEEYDDVIEQAKKQANNRLFEEVANGTPDKEFR